MIYLISFYFQLFLFFKLVYLLNVITNALKKNYAKDII
jgi:hypothetical protein